MSISAALAFVSLRLSAPDCSQVRQADLSFVARKPRIQLNQSFKVIHEHTNTRTVIQFNKAREALTSLARVKKKQQPEGKQQAN